MPPLPSATGQTNFLTWIEPLSGGGGAGWSTTSSVAVLPGLTVTGSMAGATR